MKPQSNYDDTELIKKLKENGEESMIFLYKKYWKILYISAFKILKDKDICEDIIQELFIKIWNKREELNITSSLQNYLLAAVRYEVYRKLRKLKTYEPIIDDITEMVSDLSLSNKLEFKEMQSQISSVIDTLPARCKEVYNLSRNELLSHKGISNRLSISTNTVRNQLAKALHHLRINMDQILPVLILYIFQK